MGGNLPAHHSQRVARFLQERQTQARGRLVFAIDATASRQPTWDIACALQGEMFAEAGKVGSLDVQLAYFRGNECSHSHWTSDTQKLATIMSRIDCLTGHTQIGKVLAHIRQEHAAQPVSAAIFVGDATEETPGQLYDAATGLPPMFLFQEGHDPVVEETFKQLARLTRGAFCMFTPGAARELADLLRAVAAFAVGGLTALADQRSERARKLLQQLK
jgi:hypothetical protein